MSSTINLEFISCEERKPALSGTYVVIKTPKEIGEAYWNSGLGAWTVTDDNTLICLTNVTHWAEKPKEWPDLTPYSPEWLYEKMKLCAIQDTESGHIAADEFLCETLKAKGYGDAIDVFNHMKRWYS